MVRHFEESEGRSGLMRGDVRSYRSLLHRGHQYQWEVPAIPPYTMILLAEEALEADRVEQAECLIEAVYALYE
jgi:hypothetical protein